MTYAIFEGNMERLQKKLTRIQNKCKKYGCDFCFEEVGEEFRKMEDDEGNEYTTRFVLVEAEGKAIVNDWRFVAKIEHLQAGNVITGVCGIEVPERYYKCSPYCEHCNQVRSRKDTFIVQNTKTGEFKQVGKSCLKDFTCGMDAELVAAYMAMFDDIIKGEAPYEGCHDTRYFEIKTFLQYAAETIRHFGFTPNSGYGRTTAGRASDYLYCDMGYLKGEVREKVENEMFDVGFNHNSEEAVKMAEEALAWVNEQDETSNYMHNLKTVCAEKYCTYNRFGLLASIFPTFKKDIERKVEQAKRAERDSKSEYIGKVGDRVQIEVDSFEVVTGWQTMYGFTAIYKIIDKAGNILIWKTSGEIPEGTKEIKGTVKEHKIYRETKQTEITRCKCIS